MHYVVEANCKTGYLYLGMIISGSWLTTEINRSQNTMKYLPLSESEVHTEDVRVVCFLLSIIDFNARK